MADDRERLRTTFDTAASKYARARPSYPDALFDALIAATGLRPGATVVEIGCGTGQATRALAARGFELTCVEVGPRLAEEATRALSGLPRVSVVNSAFENWQPIETYYDLVVAATSWHWVDPDVKYQHARRLLRRDGHLAFWNAIHVFPDGGDAFFAELQSVYDEIGEGLPPGAEFPRPGALADERSDIERCGIFAVVTIEQFDWEVMYNADEYIELLETFSGHIAMESWQRDRLFAEIRRRFAARSNGRLRRHWGAVLHVARRRD